MNKKIFIFVFLISCFVTAQEASIKKPKTKVNSLCIGVGIGYINMPNIKTTINDVDFATQGFFFFENTILIGGKFKLF